ncbi:hypothetical protein C7377_1426 [Balneicella halophila]|uniref:Uncharacterized protein n=1 Tax=Balneicella halophila TaxID=1537566 RepID=A0A7L4UPM0_BALHA|nr:hypothetical protein C7377_1426 [Balneicella halophila]
MKTNNVKILNALSTGTLLILLGLCFMISEDNPITWNLFPSNSLLFFPLAFFIPIILAVFSLKNKRNSIAIVLLIISIILLILTSMLALYVYGLGGT